MKKLSFRTINSLMGKELNPNQRKFMKKSNITNINEHELDSAGFDKNGNNHYQPNKHESFKGPKPNNNDLCPCGSGRKFKQCCKS